MKKAALLSFIFLTAGFVLMSPKPAAAAVSNWQKGALMQPANANDFGSDSYKQSVDKLVANGANTLGLVIPVHQSNIHSSDVQTSWDTPTDQSLAAGISYARSKGLNVTLSIHLNPWDGQWRANVSANDRTTWFQNYGNLLNKYATIAQNNNAQQIVLGTELYGMTDPGVSWQNTPGWQKMIQDVRARFSGKLTYSAQHAGYKSDAQSLGFWPQLDIIGISAYYGLGSEYEPSVASIKSKWSQWNNSEVAVLANKYGKSVVFTELGFVSKAYGLTDPGYAYTYDTPYNANVQANAYQALFEYWNNYNYMQGVLLWDWKTNPNAGGPGDRDYTPQGKPAEQIMKQWFGAPGQGGGPVQPANYTVSANTSAQPTTGNPVTVNASLTASQAVSQAIVDIEIYNSQGQQVKQQYYTDQTLGTTAKNYSFSWTPTAAGAYTIKIGAFSSNWTSNLYWNGNVATTNVADPAPQPTGPQTINVWWPGEGVTVSGAQPFKAVIDGLGTSSYNMYWQVDGGQLNLMGDSSDPVPHKRSDVDLSGWHWKANNQYVITFVAKDLNGTVIAKRSVTITVL